MSGKTRLNPKRTLQRFGFRQTIRGALIVGVLAGLLMGIQGAAYAKAFPTQASRDKLVASLGSVSGIDFFSGEVANAARPDSYAIYKSITMMTLVTAIWGLAVGTRLLRGFEEDGRLEALEAGALAKRQTSSRLLAGFAGSFAVAGMLAFALIAALGADPDVKLSAGGAALMTLAVFLPGLFFAALGVLTSQLARTRGRAILYGLVPLIALYVVRGTANSVPTINWLKKLTPFGWSDLLNPVLGPRIGWIVPTVGFAITFVVLGLVWAGKRDLGAALIRQSDTVRSRFYLLGSPIRLAVRRHLLTFIWWALGTLAFAAFFAAVANLSTNLASDSPAFKRAFTAGSGGELKLAFLGAGTMFAATVLLVMATLNLSGIRRDEAKGYLDNLLVQPTRRQNWLIGRLWLVAAMFMVIALAAGLTTWGVAHAEHITFGLGAALLGSLSLGGIMLLTLGVGAFFYGFLPKVAVAAMAVVIGWAFVFDILKSFFHFSSWVTRTSLLTYIPTNPSKAPDWTATAWLVVIGLVLAAAGVVRFTKRDIVAE